MRDRPAWIPPQASAANTPGATIHNLKTRPASRHRVTINQDSANANERLDLAPHCRKVWRKYFYRQTMGDIMIVPVVLTGLLLYGVAMGLILTHRDH